MGIEVKIVDENGNEVPDGKVGEIVARVITSPWDIGRCPKTRPKHSRTVGFIRGTWVQG